MSDLQPYTVCDDGSIDVELTTMKNVRFELEKTASHGAGQPLIGTLTYTGDGIPPDALGKVPVLFYWTIDDESKLLTTAQPHGMHIEILFSEGDHVVRALVYVT